jgi:DNA-damage-inducible protein D
LRRDSVDTKNEAYRTHYEVGKKVRDTIAEIGGTMPENLSTPEKGIKQLVREKAKKQICYQQNDNDE